MQLRGLSNEALQASLGALVGTGRELTANVIAHLGEVEERRLHLLEGSRSMFDYCTVRLRMSEDEACRRIEVARLAVRFPMLLERLASGALSLSVAALLKNYLTEANHGTLLAAVSGKTVGQAREALVAWFPRPDVPDSIRKLPEHAGLVGVGVGTTIAPQRAPASSTVPASSTMPPAAEVGTPEAGSESEATTGADQSHTTRSVEPAATNQSTTLASKPPPMRGARSSCPFEPLSPGRFKVTFTANAELKQKIELARDLLRHAVPNGDLATIVARAIDLLLEEKERRRFAKSSKPSPKGAPHSEQEHTAAPCSANQLRDARATTIPNHAPGATYARNEGACRGAAISPGAAPVSPDAPLNGDTPSNTDATKFDEPSKGGAPASSDAPANAAPRSAHRAHTPDDASISKARQLSTAPARESRYLPHEVRRAVLERDGMRCSWHAPDGTRCNSRAWLEHDHIIPRGCGGTDDPTNIRTLCRAHNRLAAEQTYGKATIRRMMARRRAARGQRSTHGGRADNGLP